MTTQTLQPIFDTIVVGGGSAGSVLAHRLSADPARRVLLVEAGADTAPGNVPPEISDGLQPWLPRISGERFLWPGLHVWRAAGHPGIDRAPQYYEQGRILGGGSSVNMTVANRGVPRDYDEWAALGAEGWGWRDVLPYFRKLETDDADTVEDDGTPLHGRDGPIAITRPDHREWSDFTRSIADALDARGLANIVDQNGRFGDGYFSPTVNVKDGRRFTTAHGYLDVATRARPNLAIWTDTHALRLLLDGRRVVGLEVERDGKVFAIGAGEVVLAAGALQSPGFLLRAGIGPADELVALGIAPVVDRPGVGRNLLDHSSLGIAARLTPEAAAAAGTGPRSTHALGIRTSSGQAPAIASDLFFHITPDTVAGHLAGVLWLNKPRSTGSLRLRSADPRDFAEIDFNLLSDPRDLAALRSALELIRSLFEHGALAAFGLDLLISRFAQPAFDGPRLADLLDDELAFEDYVRTNVSGVWHASGTARIGRFDDPAAVVDSSGRVHGIHGLRVADASVMPTVPAANTNIPTIMVAEKIADAIVHGA